MKTATINNPAVIRKEISDFRGNQRLRHIKTRSEDLRNLLIAIILLIATTMLAVWAEDKEYGINKDFPLLSNNVSEIETLIGDYSDFYIVLNKDNNSLIHSIGSIDDGQGNYILLIPQYLKKNDIVLDFYTCWDEYLKSYKCDFTDNKTYKVKDKTISIMSSDMQFVFIDVDTQALNEINKEYTDTWTKKKTKASLITVSPTGKKVFTEITMKPRGQSSWGLYNKKPYSVKTTKRCDPFGLGNEKKWNILSNASDKTLLKNEVFFNMAKKLGLSYTPQIKNVHLFYNSSYTGVYTITTKIDSFMQNLNQFKGDFLINWGEPRSKNTVDFKCDYWTDINIQLENGELEPASYVGITWPEKEKTTSGLKKNVQRVVQNYLDVLEGRKEGKLSDHIDIESWAKYYWIQEISMNADAWSRSNYTYYRTDTEKLYAGPIWDMEWALGTIMEKHEGDKTILFNNPEGWVIREHGYFAVLFKNKEFREAVEKVYKNCNIEELMREACDEYKEKAKEHEAEGDINLIASPEEINWHDIEYKDTKIYMDYVNKKADFLRKRTEWISKQQGAN